MKWKILKDNRKDIAKILDTLSIVSYEKALDLISKQDSQIFQMINQIRYRSPNGPKVHALNGWDAVDELNNT